MSRAVYSGTKDGETVTVTLTVHKGTPQQTITFDRTELQLVAFVSDARRMFAVGVRHRDGTGWSASRIPPEPTDAEKDAMWDAVLTAIGARQQMQKARGRTDAQYTTGHKRWQETQS